MAASLHCTPNLTASGPVVSQACLAAALAVFIQCPNENHVGLPGLPRSQASLQPLPLGSTLFPWALQILGDSWAPALIRPIQFANVPGALNPSYYHLPELFIAFWALQGSGGHGRAPI